MKTNTSIATVTETIYGVNALTCEAHVIEWAAERVAAVVGADKAAAQWKRLSARRNRMGRYTTIPQYGTAMFAAW